METAKSRAEAYVRSKIPDGFSECHLCHKEGLQPALNDWLRVSMTFTREWANNDGNLYAVSVGGKRITFNLTTGQPASEADYQSFLTIVGEGKQ